MALLAHNARGDREDNNHTVVFAHRAEAEYRHLRVHHEVSRNAPARFDGAQVRDGDGDGELAEVTGIAQRVSVRLFVAPSALSLFFISRP